MGDLPTRIIEAGWWFHGQEKEGVDFGRAVFFSRDAREAWDRGKAMYCAWIEGLEVFDTLDLDSVRSFMDGEPIIDPYDETEYATAEEFLEGCWHDTWTPFEELGLSHDALIYEGGVQNLWLQSGGKGKVKLYRMPDGPLYLLLPESSREAIGASGIGKEVAEAAVLSTDRLRPPEGFDMYEVRLDGIGIVPADSEAGTWRIHDAGFGIGCTNLILASSDASLCP